MSVINLSNCLSIPIDNEDIEVLRQKFLQETGKIFNDQCIPKTIPQNKLSEFSELEKRLIAEYCWWERMTKDAKDGKVALKDFNVDEGKDQSSKAAILHELCDIAIQKRREKGTKVPLIVMGSFKLQAIYRLCGDMTEEAMKSPLLRFIISSVGSNFPKPFTADGFWDHAIEPFRDFLFGLPLQVSEQMMIQVPFSSPPSADERDLLVHELNRMNTCKEEDEIFEAAFNLALFLDADIPFDCTEQCLKDVIRLAQEKLNEKPTIMSTIRDHPYGFAAVGVAIFGFVAYRYFKK
eukprot:TRINITY_DN9086_c0_g1_i1.p1 TRINITY_DN9086_c0_g1~~TRINITY_DN9086_c0_g1_i1.p1  ORF type:complete len:308 (-),score=73.74 TRINITY_DN9086_c0_g1_i1:6-884(-)